MGCEHFLFTNDKRVKTTRELAQTLVKYTIHWLLIQRPPDLILRELPAVIPGRALQNPRQSPHYFRPNTMLLCIIARIARVVSVLLVDVKNKERG